MSETPHPTEQRTRFLLTSLIIITIFILTLVFLAAAYPTLLAPDPTATPTITNTPRPTLTATLITPSPTVTLTPAPSRTLRPTLTPSITPTPTLTLTPTLTATPIGPPTLTPATPVLGFDNYKLEGWSADQAAELIDLLENYPNTLTRQMRGEDDTAYYRAFTYATFAQQEALLRFPDAPQAEEWAWSLAYDLARTADPQAAGQYADLILRGLNRGETEVSGLRSWFKTKELRAVLYAIELDPPSGYLSSHVVEVRNLGSAYIWLLETSGAFQAYTLASNFDFVAKPSYSTLIADLTGDGSDEVAIFPLEPTEDFELVPPQIFNLKEAPPQELMIQPSKVDFGMGMPFRNQWVVRQNGEDSNQLVFDTTVFPACPLTVQRAFEWNGDYFGLVDTSFSLQSHEKTLGFCQLAVEHAAQVWGPQASIPLVERVLPDWPPPQDAEGNPTRPDALDEMRYRLGVYRALVGDFDGARSALTSILEDPSTTNSQWIDPASDFLDVYQEAGDVYSACVRAQFCNPRDALRYLIETQPIQSSGEVIEHLWQHGVAVHSSGYFDFEGDGQSERWFTVQHQPLAKIEFWILSSSLENMDAIFVGFVGASAPVLLFPDPDNLPSIVWVDDVAAIRMERDPLTQEAYIERFPQQYQWRNRYQEGLEAAERDLFSGEDPKEVRRRLLVLEEFPGLLCRPYWTCDPYYYLLGLSSELAGYEGEAIEAYLRLWWDYSRSPFTTMARLKLSRTKLPTPTPTAMYTATPTTTNGSTLPASTPSPTLEPTATDSAYPPPGSDAGVIPTANPYP